MGIPANIFSWSLMKEQLENIFNVLIKGERDSPSGPNI